MITLLPAIQSDLRASADLSMVADADIFITADESLIPTTVGFPAIGIKDGAINYLIEEGADWETGLDVDLIIFQELKAGDVSIIGQVDPKVYGVLEIVAGIHSTLFDNKLSISGMEAALPVGEGPVEWMEGGGGDLNVVRKRVTYHYRKLEVNP